MRECTSLRTYPTHWDRHKKQILSGTTRKPTLPAGPAKAWFHFFHQENHRQWSGPKKHWNGTLRMLGAGNNCRLKKQGDQASAPPRIKQKNSLRKQRGAQTVFVFPI